MSVELAPTRRLTFSDSLLPKSLRLYLLATISLALISATYTLVGSKVFHQTYPYGLPAFGGLPPFTDFTIFDERFTHFGSPSFWEPFNYPFTYPAPLAVVFGLFAKLPDPLASYLGLCLAGFCFGGAMLVLHLRESCSTRASVLFTAAIALSCWPCAFLISRANIEGVDALILAVGILAVLKDQDCIGGTLIGLAASMKLFPITLLALLISKRRYAACSLGVLVCGLATLISLAILDPSVAAGARHIGEGLDYFRHAYAEKISFPEFDHSLFALYKVAYAGLRGTSGMSFAGALAIYTPLVAVSGGALYVIRIRSMPVLNQVIALTTCSVLMPPVSYDYTLVHLLVPCGLLCVYAATTGRLASPTKGVTPALICFSVIFTWGTFLNIDGRVAGQVRAVAMLALIGVVLRYPFAGLSEQAPKTE